MKLLIVESPSKAKTISKYLGKDFIVRASVGHVRDLPKSNKKAVDIEGGFIPHYEVVAKKQTIIDEIRIEAEKADEILLATDPDREGEAIAWHLKELLTKKGLSDGYDKIPASKIKRITYHEVTKEAVEEALKSPRPIDENLKEAQEARRVLDRIVGYDLSGLIWKKVRYGLSAGRVQSPALRIIMEREREIRAFKPETYWTIAGDWLTTKDGKLHLSCSVEPKKKEEAEYIIDTAKKNDWKVIDIEESEQKRSPRAPFITSTLQQTASSRLGFSPSRTMSIAQKLYESGYITYMRTDSTNLGEQALAQISQVVEKEYGKNYLHIRTYATKSKNAQEAHEAIRPSHFNKSVAGHTDEQKRLYKLIWQRAVASQMADARLAKTKIIANILESVENILPPRTASEAASTVEAATNVDFAKQTKTFSRAEEGEAAGGIPNFEANGSRILFDGWLKADPDSSGDEVNLPKCDKGESLKLLNIDSEEKQTQPPSRYTEAGLIKELEKRGIGRPSTYASISKTIEDRGYVEKEGRSLKPTDIGEVVSTFLEENFPTYISDDFTAEMENELDEIANGERTYLKTLTDFYGPFHKEVKSKEKIDKLTNLGLADSKFKCPKCGSPSMEIKLGKNGKFISCSKYPDCDGALTIDGMEFKKDEPIGIDPTTGLPIFVLNGRFGPYVQLGERIKGKIKIKSPARFAGRSLARGEKLKVKSEEQDANKIVANFKPKMASIPKNADPMKVTVADALKYLSLPKVLGIDPKTNKEITASIGRFGPYVVLDGDFRSVKAPDDIYNITFERALELLAQEKKQRGFKKKIKEVNP
ncbi:MAG: type I DNA topoisomerase [Candidatus Paceibacterota bacterium]|jgi:DNA topoisomerase-1